MYWSDRTTMSQSRYTSSDPVSQTTPKWRKRRQYEGRGPNNGHDIIAESVNSSSKTSHQTRRSPRPPNSSALLCNDLRWLGNQKSDPTLRRINQSTSMIEWSVEMVEGGCIDWFRCYPDGSINDMGMLTSVRHKFCQAMAASGSFYISSGTWGPPRVLINLHCIHSQMLQEINSYLCAWKIIRLDDLVRFFVGISHDNHLGATGHKLSINSAYPIQNVLLANSRSSLYVVQKSYDILRLIL